MTAVLKPDSWASRLLRTAGERPGHHSTAREITSSNRLLQPPAIFPAPDGARGARSKAAPTAPALIELYACPTPCRLRLCALCAADIAGLCFDFVHQRPYSREFTPGSPHGRG